MVEIEVDTSELRSFFDKCVKAGGGELKREFELFLEGIGMEFLRIIQDEIISKQVVDTRLLLNSFQKGEKDNVWELNQGNLILEIGTNVDYAKYANDGHWQDKRFIPGKWSNDRFVYDPNEKSGMMLTAKRVEGKHYWENAIEVLERTIPDCLDSKLQEWLDKYFG